MRRMLDVYLENDKQCIRRKAEQAAVASVKAGKNKTKAPIKNVSMGALFYFDSSDL